MSRIEGKSNVIFGGSIGGSLSNAIRNVDSKPVVILGFNELIGKYDVGDTNKHDTKEPDAQVKFVFDNVKSIDVVIRWLKGARRDLLIAQEEQEEQKEQEEEEEDDKAMSKVVSLDDRR